MAQYLLDNSGVILTTDTVDLLTTDTSGTGGGGSVAGGFRGKSRIRIDREEDYYGKIPIGSGFCGES